MQKRENPPKWQCIRSEIGPKIPLFNIRLDWMEHPRTQQVMQRLVFESAEWVNITPITPEGKVIMVLQYRFGVGAITTEIPGGIVDPGENSEQAARRELLEETGYEAENWRYLGAVQANPAIQDNLCHHWLAENVRQVQPPDPGEGEDLTVLALSLEEIKEEVQAGRLLHSLALSGLSRVFDLREALSSP